MNPYRTPPQAPPPDPEDMYLDERPLLWLLVAVAVVRAVYLVVYKSPWDTGSVLMALLSGFVARELSTSSRRV